MSQFMDELRDKIRVKQYSYKTEKAYLNWTERFIRFHGIRHPKAMGKAEVETFLTDLAKSGVSASTQNQHWRRSYSCIVKCLTCDLRIFEQYGQNDQHIFQLY